MKSLGNLYTWQSRVSLHLFTEQFEASKKSGCFIASCKANNCRVDSCRLNSCYMESCSKNRK